LITTRIIIGKGEKMKSKIAIGIIALYLAVTVIGCATEEGRQAGRGAGIGAAGGAALGLAMGAMPGEAGFAAAGAAAGAMAGAAAGGMYMYDQSRDDRRTKMLADSIGGAQKGETADDAGKRHLDDFLGDWKLDIWTLNAQGNKLTATGRAIGILEGKETARIDYANITAEGFDPISGSSVLTYSPSKGFTLENNFSAVQGSRTYVGEYLPAENAYNFYPSTNKDGETITGVIRSNVRIAMRVSGNNLIVAETYTLKDGKETMMQSYRFTK